MDAGEGLIEARAHALELIVRVTGDQTCYVALPQRVVGTLNAAAPPLPLPLALIKSSSSSRHSSSRGDGPAGRQHGRGGDRGGGDTATHHTRGSQSAPLFVAWAGATCSSVGSEDAVEMSLALADCLGLRDGDVCRVTGRPNAPYAQVVELAPESQEDWIRLLGCAEDVEADLLTQCGCVAAGCPFPFWPSGGKAAPIRLVPTAVRPHSPGAVARLRLDTELHVAPWAPSAPPGAPGAPGTSANVSQKNEHAANTEPAAPPPPPRQPPEIPTVTRVQSARGVVVAWPRRLRFSRDSSNASTGEKEIVAWPTTHAFVSEATAEKSTGGLLTHGRVVHVAAIGGGASGAKAAHELAPGDASSGVRGCVVRVVVISGGGVADGHVALAPALRDALGATQGTRVTVTTPASVDAGADAGVDAGASNPSPPLIRLRPVTYDGGGGGTGGDPPSPPGSDLTPAHRSALSLPFLSDDDDVVDDAATAFNAAARDLLARWSATVARFSMTSRTMTSGDDDGAAAPTVSTGSIVQLRVGDDGDRATFELEVHARGGTCELTADILRAPAKDAVEDAGAAGGTGEGANNTSRVAIVELGPSISRVRHDPSPHSKLFGNAVTVDPTLRDSLGTVAPEGSAAAATVSAATARLTLALASFKNKFKKGPRAVGSPGPPGGVLLWGAPGSGRSGMARCIARTLRDDNKTLASVVYVSCGSMYGSSGGDPRAAVAAVKAAFASAVKRAPSVVILDDLDAIAGATHGDGPGGGQSVPAGETVSEVIADAIDATMHLGVVTLAASSSPESVHVAVRAAGRLDHECELRSPDAVAGREAVVTAHAAARGTPVLGADVASTAAIDAEGYARGDLTTLVERAAHAAAARSMRSTSAVTVEDSGKLGHADFKDASVGLVPAPARALGGGSGSTLKATDKDGDEDPLVRVGGLVDVKAALDDALSLPSRHPAIFGNAPLRLRTGVLLYGPPGCGKTMIIASAIKSAGLRAVSIKGPELLNKYIGQSEAGVRDAFRRAAAAAPCALFFDEFDSIAPRRGHDSTGEFIFIFGYFGYFGYFWLFLVIFGYFRMGYLTDVTFCKQASRIAW